MSKAVVLLVPDEYAQQIADLIGSALVLNGFGVNKPSVIEWPTGRTDGSAVVWAKDVADAAHIIDTYNEQPCPLTARLRAAIDPAFTDALNEGASLPNWPEPTR